MEIVMKNIVDIMPYENNPRHNEDAVKKVAESIKEFGFKVPIVIDENNVIITGHTRHKAAFLLGMDRIPCIMADDLSEDQIRAFRLADNKVAEFSTWDFEKLKDEIDLIDMDLAEFGFEKLGDAEREIEDSITNPYTQKVEIPHYEIKGELPSFGEMVETWKAEGLIEKIERANVTDEERIFLKLAAGRHNIFNYGKIAEYYAHAGAEMQGLMEDSALVIIDFEDAIRRGYVKLSTNIEQLYNEEYVDE